MKISAVFLDRDGVLNPHIPGGYLRSAADLTLLPGVAQAVRRLNDAGLPVVIISNQQGVGKGLMSMEDLLEIETRMGEMLERESGARLECCYYATELQNSRSPRRKPSPGMLLEAAEELGIALPQTVFAGDSRTDIAAGFAASVGATILLLCGGTQSYAVGDMDPAPDYVFADLPTAVDWILENAR